tara:strand:- start:21110 stop:21811 length:702 start_codon:yes stop_codon:yes gene_type:complete
MKIFVATSDYCINALTPFTYLFNKFWEDKPKVTILNRGIIDKFELPNNFNIISLGPNKGMKNWCSDFRKYFETIEDEYFIFMQEDHFPIRPIIDKSYKALLSCLKDENIGRIAITNDPINKPYSLYKNVNNIQIIESNQTANYRVSCQPSIWSKEFMLKYMKSDLGGPWEFEMQYPHNDGYKVLGTQTDYPMIVSNAILKGDWDENWYKSMHGSDYFELDSKIIQEMEKLQII